MSRSWLCLLLAWAPALAACATSFPNPKPLCGTWEGGHVGERWWIDGRDLHGEGYVLDGAGEITLTERLQLRADKRGHVYVAQPGEATPTEFSPIDPSTARSPVRIPAAALVWSWANYDHDFPQEIHYVLVGDKLDTTIAATHGNRGHGMAWKLVRIAGCDESP